MANRSVLLAVFCAFSAAAAVVDRIAVVVDKAVFTETEVIREVRLTEFLNHEPPDLSPGKKRAAADRLVDQQLLRNEMKVANTPEISAAEANAILQKFVEQFYPNAAAYQAVLAKYGITEDQLKARLAWQTALIRFTELRFQPPAEPPEDGANRSAAPSTAPPSVDQQMDEWLKGARAQTRIQFKEEAFQ